MDAILRIRRWLGSAPDDGAARRRGWLLVAGAALVAWLWFTLPLAAGRETLFFRDVLDNHLALKAFGAAELAEGRIPAFNPSLGLGQPFRGNPSALAFYPGNLLYLALPFWSAFNLHYALHWLLALVSMAVLARRLDLGAEAALLAGLTYAGSGFVLSGLTLYNTLTVVAWWPLAIAGVVAAGRRGLALGGIACGMALLGGEPLTAALGLVPMLVVGIRRHGLRRGFVRSFAVGALGLLVAAPQVVATARIVGFSFRGNFGVGNLATEFSVPPLRLLELLVPLPFGWPLDIGEQGWWLARMAPNLVFYFSLYVGIVGLWLGLRGVRRRPELGLLAGAGVAAAILLGLAPGLVLALGGGVFRYPEKLLFWYVLAIPLLAGYGLDRALEPAPRDEGTERPRPRYRGALAGGGALLLAAVVLAVARPAAIQASPLPGWFAVQSLQWVLYLAVGGALLLMAAFALRRRAAAVVVALQLCALLQLYPLARTTPAEPFRQAPPWADLLRHELEQPSVAVVNTLIYRPPWEPHPPHQPQGRSHALNYLRHHADLHPGAGILHGLTYPLAPDIEGLTAPLYSLLTVKMKNLDWSARIPWIRASGAEAVVLYRPRDVGEAEGLTRIGGVVRDGVESHLYRVVDPAPAAWWPRRVEAAGSPQQAFARVSALEDPVEVVVASAAVEHHPEAEVEIVEEGPDHVVLEVRSASGGLLVVRRSFHSLYRARSGDLELPKVAAQLALLGVVVPAGEHRVVVDVDPRPVLVGATTAILTLLVLVVLAWRGDGPRKRGGRRSAGPPEEDRPSMEGTAR